MNVRVSKGVDVRCFRVGMHLRPYVGIIVFKYMDVCVNGVDIGCFMVNL